MRAQSLIFAITSILYVPALVSSSVLPQKIRGITRRATPLSPSPITFKSSVKGASNSTSHTSGVQSNNSSDEPIPFECDVTVEDADGSLSYSSTFPNQLQFVSWVGAGLVTCTLPMTFITMTITASNALGESAPIANAEPCVECSELDAVSTNYFCQQAQFGGTCSGEWSVSDEVVIEAPMGSIFDLASANCIIDGPILTCSVSAVAGTARPYENANLPDGYVDDIELGETAIDDIRATHFPGGASVDKTKGLFLPTVTDADLQNIFQQGLLSTNEWTTTSLGNFEKQFPYAGVGITNEGDPSFQVTMRITPSGGVVTTMYPS